MVLDSFLRLEKGTESVNPLLHWTQFQYSDKSQLSFSSPQNLDLRREQAWSERRGDYE